MRKTIYFIIPLLVLTSVFTAASAEDSKEYIISVNDVLEISVYNEPDLTKIVRVLDDGTVNYPLLGNISAAGLPVRELENKIRDMLAEDYLVSPQVSVFVKEYAKISVLGQVKQPGSYELKGHLGIVQAIALAGGFTETGNPAKVKVIRKTKGNEETFNIDTTLMAEKAIGPNEIALQPGDIIFVEEYGRISVLGQVNKPGSYLLKKDFTVLEAIAMAGGFTKIAATDATQVIRQEEGRRRVFRVKVSAIMDGDKSYDIALLPGDTVVVPESFF
jgi:polysaccharide export outer membrane protein